MKALKWFWNCAICICFCKIAARGCRTAAGTKYPLSSDFASGNPEDKHISTSYVERSHLSIRMHNRRFTRLTNAFSKKFMNHVHALALYFVFYNFCRQHKTLRLTPAMAAGLTDKQMGFEDIVALMDAVAPAPARPKVYKKKPLQISN